MILCLFGTNPYQFTRLAMALDMLSVNLSKEIFIQSGTTTYDFKNCKNISFLSHDRLIEKIKSSELVICQGGYGSIVESLENNKPVISIPRYPILNESADEQRETVQYFYDENLIEACFDDLDDLEIKVTRLLDGVVSLKKYSEYLFENDDECIQDIIRKYLLV